MNPEIEIEEMRISSNGEHLEFIINAPHGYEFKEFTIQVGDDDDIYSIGDSLFKDEDGEYVENEENRFVGQVPVSLFGVTEPSIYTIHLEAERKADEEGEYPEYIYADAHISDVSHAYDCLMDDILNLQAKCSDKEAQDRVIRNYLTLYAHQEALRLGYMDEAAKWFRLIETCFTGKCGKPGDRNVKGGCGCGHHERPRKPQGRPDFYANCGCKK